ncbi:hypothetical protein HYT24_00245 [Candidatus Pacearchaeota archaeon]|nr:hypothetical protein [Candidatus Pacearchaeota archaeon]
MNYSVYTTETFDREIFKLSKADNDRIEKMFLQLRSNPYVGDQLRYKHLREKRLDGKRIYYLVYDDLISVLMVAISSKKNQQATINSIVKNFDEYRKYLEKLLRRN